MSVWDCNVITVAMAFLFSFFCFFAVIKKGLEQLRGDSSCAALLTSLLGGFLFFFGGRMVKNRKENVNLLAFFLCQPIFCRPFFVHATPAGGGGWGQQDHAGCR